MWTADERRGWSTASCPEQTDGQRVSSRFVVAEQDARGQIRQGHQIPESNQTRRQVAAPLLRSNAPVAVIYSRLTVMYQVREAEWKLKSSIKLQKGLKVPQRFFFPEVTQDLAQ